MPGHAPTTLHRLKKRMSWKKIVAKEWLWLMCTVGGVLLLWGIASGIHSSVTVSRYCEGVLEADSDVQTVVIGSIAFVYFVRLTTWAIRQIRK